MSYISRVLLTATPLPIKATLSGSHCCSTAGASVTAYAPVCALARALIRAGHDPNRELIVCRGPTLCFATKLATTARLRVKDDKDGIPRFKEYVPFSAARVPPPIAPNDPPALPVPAAAGGATSEVVS
jgi:hypothetical protein